MAIPAVTTQAEYSELVEYARSRFIDIVPEIDMPGATRRWPPYARLNCDGQAPDLAASRSGSARSASTELTQVFWTT
ncbi:MAG: family 20 glycosylhydrolase [Caldilineae bacterium]|nr:family 20 glycosylhydrolase [Caldilineae bacterium]